MTTTKTTFTPYADRILVKRDEITLTTPGGVVLPDVAVPKTTSGVVAAVGPGRRLDDGTFVPMGVRVGDHVKFAEFSFEPITLDGEEFVLVQEHAILGVIAQAESEVITGL